MRRLSQPPHPPDRAIDKALALGDIAVTLPYIKKKDMEALKTSHSSNEEAT
jgi:hypothetical protein